MVDTHVQGDGMRIYVNAYAAFDYKLWAIFYR